MIASEKSHQNSSNYIQFLIKKWFKLIQKNSGEKKRNSDKYIYDYAHSFIEEVLLQRAILVYIENLVQ